MCEPSGDHTARAPVAGRRWRCRARSWHQPVPVPRASAPVLGLGRAAAGRRRSVADSCGASDNLRLVARKHGAFFVGLIPLPHNTVDWELCRNRQVGGLLAAPCCVLPSVSVFFAAFGVCNRCTQAKGNRSSAGGSRRRKRGSIAMLENPLTARFRRGKVILEAQLPASIGSWANNPIPVWTASAEPERVYSYGQ